MSGAHAVRLEARGLEVVRGRGRAAFRLCVPELALRAGEALAVLGPNGAGKSTLLRALAGLTPLAAGRVEGQAAAPVTLVFQRPLPFAGSVAWNVEIGLRGLGLPGATRRARAAEALAAFGIQALARRPAATLSGGELRRLALARALARRPAVLLLDEPFDDLDAPAQEALSLDLRRATLEHGTALALVTHDLGRALLLADRIAVLRDGRITQQGPRAELLERPATPATARLVGMHNLVPGVIAISGDGSSRVAVGPEHAIPMASDLPIGTPVYAGIRPESLKVDVGRGEGVPIGKARVRHLHAGAALAALEVEWAGHSLRAHLLAGRGLARTLRPGDAVALAVRPEDVHLLARDPQAGG